MTASNTDIINRFYTSFANADAEGMVSCYHDDIVFQDPAFGVLRGNDAKNMWRMLLRNPDIKIEHSSVQADAATGSADWVAHYTFSKTGRKVVNHVSAKFEFKDGKIIKHTDHFDMWTWSRQALGLPGLLLGWSSFMRNKVNKQARERLQQFTRKSSDELTD